LYREGWLTAVELRGRLRALQALAEGKVRPVLEGTGTAMPPAGKQMPCSCNPANASGDTEEAKGGDNNADIALKFDEDRLEPRSPAAK